MTDRELLSLPVAAVLDGYARKAFSPVDTARAALAQVAALDPQLNAFALKPDADAVMAAARQSEARWQRGAPAGVLDGILTTVKDGIDVAGWPTREGSLTTSAAPVATDTPSVAYLRRAGVIFLGKTTLPEYGHKGVTDSPLTGVTRNPWNPSKTSGGSSGGAAVAATTGMGWLHQGSDGGGSIRIPASFCGCFGIKPTQGLVPVSATGVFSKLSSSGPMARCVADAALMLGEMTGKGRIYVDALVEKPAGLRIAYARTINGQAVDPDVAACVDAAADVARDVGTVTEIDLDIPQLVETFNLHWGAIAAWLVSQFPPDRQEMMDPCLRAWAQRGAEIKMERFMAAELNRLQIIDSMKTLFSTYDALILPTMAQTAFDIGKNMPEDAQGQPWEDWTPFTFPANLGQLPAASLPCGVTREKLPVGAQIVSGAFREDIVLYLSRALEERLGFCGWMDCDL